MLVRKKFKFEFAETQRKLCLLIEFSHELIKKEKKKHAHPEDTIFHHKSGEENVRENTQTQRILGSEGDQKTSLGIFGDFRGLPGVSGDFLRFPRISWDFQVNSCRKSGIPEIPCASV
jgi:hypothetical protein